MLIDLLARLLFKLGGISIVAAVIPFVGALFSGSPPTWESYQVWWWIVFAVDLFWSLVSSSS